MITSFCHRFAAALLLAATLPASAASFDCSKAKTEVEKAVCADPQLSELDVQLANAWRGTLNAAKDPGLMRVRQREWAASRDTCGEGEMKTCLADSYRDRISLLQKLTEALQQSPSPAAGKPYESGMYRLFAKRLEGESAVIYIYRKGDSKPWQTLPVLVMPNDLDIAPRITKINDSAQILEVYNGRGGLHSTASYDFYVSSNGSQFIYSEAITNLALDTLSGVEIMGDELETVSSDAGTTRSTSTRYKLVDGKPQIARREIFDGESDRKFDFTTYETYRDGKLVKSWTKKEKR
jgi:uncharacterized protein